MSGAPLSDEARRRLLDAAAPLLSEEGAGAELLGRYRLVRGALA
jgi:hypothetical protein